MNIQQLLISAILIEAIVTSVNLIVRERREIDWRYLLAIATGIIVALVYSIDAFEFVGLMSDVPYVGSALTGIVLARGANYVNDLLDVVKSYRQLAS